MSYQLQIMLELAVSMHRQRASVDSEAKWKALVDLQNTSWRSAGYNSHHPQFELMLSYLLETFIHSFLSVAYLPTDGTIPILLYWPVPP